MTLEELIREATAELNRGAPPDSKVVILDTRTGDCSHPRKVVTVDGETLSLVVITAS